MLEWRGSGLRPALVATLGAGILLGGAAPASAGPVDPDATRGMTERRLRAFEERVLGPAHAAEHAATRRALRSPAVRRALARKALRDRRAARRPRARRASATVGAWTGAPFSIPVMGIHSAMLPTGKVLWFSYPTNPSRGTRVNEGRAVLWDPATGATKRVDPPIDPATGRPVNIWCAGQSFLADGRVLVTGGTLRYQETGYSYRGLKRAYTFDPFTETWAEQPSMRHGRWYPSQVLQPDGSTLILSGLDENGKPKKGHDTPLNKDVEIFTPDPNGRGTMTLASGPSHSLKGMYPHLFLMPSGRTLVAGPYQVDSFYLTLSGSSYATGSVPNLLKERYWGSAVLVPGGPAGSDTVMALGGSDRDTSSGNMSSTETFREGASAWTSASSMTVARAHHNTVLLPDGSMVSVGGGYGVVGGDQWVSGSSHKSVDLWDPATRAWTKGPSQVENRGYHSTAVLLPDGRVLSAGDDVNGGIDRDTAEIYSPPYLFQGDRPAISSAPSSIGWGERFAVGTPSAGVTRAVLVAPGAVTHSVDMNQRVVSLALTPGAAGVDLTAPANGRIAPPGYYMLFLLNDRGVPSVARWVRLGASSAPAPGDTAPPTAPTALSATAASPARVDLSWTASSDDVGVTGYEIVREGATVATVTGTSWADTSVAPSTSYEYRVRARDAAGNLSGLSSPATVATPAGGGAATLTFAAAADVSVEEKDASGNYGTSTVLRVDAGGDPDAQTYLRFDVGGLPGPVRSARLRLFTSNGTANGPPAYATSSSWTETGLTWLARPAATSAGRDDKGAIGLGVWVEWDVTPFVTGDGPVSLMLAGTSSDGVDFYSRETANGPQLVVSTG